MLKKEYVVSKFIDDYAMDGIFYYMTLLF